MEHRLESKSHPQSRKLRLTAAVVQARTQFSADGPVKRYVSAFTTVGIITGGQLRGVVILGWIGAVLTLGSLFYANERLQLPSAVIRISDSEGFVRKHATELTLAVAAASLIVAFIGLFIGK